MKNITRLLWILILLTGCIGETDCPSFPDSRLSWLPYQQDSFIQFTDGIDTLFFVIDEASRTGNYSFKKNCKCDCEANALFKTSISYRLNAIEGYSNYYGDITEYQYRFIQYSGTSFTSFDDFFFRNENGTISSDLMEQYQIGDKTYNRVIKLDLDTISDNSLNWRKPEIWRIIIADSIGIIQFNECRTHKIWQLISSSH